MPVLYFNHTITYPTLSYYAFHYSRFLESPDEYSLRFRSTVEAYTSFVDHLLSFPDVTITTEYFSDGLIVTYLCPDASYGGTLDSAFQEFSKMQKSHPEGLDRGQSGLRDVSVGDRDGFECGTASDYLSEEDQGAARNYWEYIQEGPQCYYRSDGPSYDYDRNEVSHSPTSILHRGEYEDATCDYTLDSVQGYPHELTSGYEQALVSDFAGHPAQDDIRRVQDEPRRESPVYDGINDVWNEDEDQSYQEDEAQDRTLVYSPGEALKYTSDEYQAEEPTFEALGGFYSPLQGMMDGEDDIDDAIQVFRETTMSDSELDRLYMLSLRASTSESFDIDRLLADTGGCDETVAYFDNLNEGLVFEETAREYNQDKIDGDTDEITGAYEEDHLDYDGDEARFYPNDETLVYELEEDEDYKDDYGYEDELNNSSDIMDLQDHLTEEDLQAAVSYDVIHDSNAASIRSVHASLSSNSDQSSGHYEYEEQQEDTTPISDLEEGDYADVVITLEDALDALVIAYTPVSCIKSTSGLPSLTGSFILSPSPSTSTMNSDAATFQNSVYESFLWALTWSIILAIAFLTISVVTGFGALRDVEFILSPRSMINGNALAKGNNEAGQGSILSNRLDNTPFGAELAVRTSTSYDSFFKSLPLPCAPTAVVVISPNGDRQSELSPILESMKRLGIAMLYTLTYATSLLYTLYESIKFHFTQLMDNLECIAFIAFILAFRILHTKFSFKFSSYHRYPLALYEYAKKTGASTVIAISSASACIKSYLRLATDGWGLGVIWASKAFIRTSVGVFVILGSALCAAMEFVRYCTTCGFGMRRIATEPGCGVVDVTTRLDHDDRGDKDGELLPKSTSQPQSRHVSDKGNGWETSLEQAGDDTDRACHHAVISLKDLISRPTVAQGQDMKFGFGFDWNLNDGNQFKLGGAGDEIMCYVMNGSESPDSPTGVASDHPPPPARGQSGIGERGREGGTLGSRFWNMISSTRRRMLPSRSGPGPERQIGRSASQELEPGERGESEMQQAEAEEEEEEQNEEGMCDATLIEEDTLATLQLATEVNLRKDDADDSCENEANREGEGEENLDVTRPEPQQPEEAPVISELESLQTSRLSPEHEDRDRPVADPVFEWNLPAESSGIEVRSNEADTPGPSESRKGDANARDDTQMIGSGTGTPTVGDFDFSGSTAFMESVNDEELELTQSAGTDIDGMNVSMSRHGENSSAEEQLKKRRKKKKGTKRRKDRGVKDLDQADQSLSLSLLLPTPTSSANPATTTPGTEPAISTESDANPIITNSNTMRSSTPRNMAPPWNVGSRFPTTSSRRYSSTGNTLSPSPREPPGDVSQTNTSPSMNMDELEWSAHLDGIPIPHNNSDDEEEFGISLRLKVKPKKKIIEASIEATPKIWSVHSNLVDIKSSPPLSEFETLPRGLATSTLPFQTPEPHYRWGRGEDVRELESRELEFGKWAWRDKKGVPRSARGNSPRIGLGLRSVDDDPPDLIADDSDGEESEGEVLPTLGSRLALVDLEGYSRVTPSCEDGDADGDDEDEDIDGSPLPIDEESKQYESSSQFGTSLKHSTTPAGDPEEWKGKPASKNASGSGGKRVTFDIPHDTDNESEDGLDHTEIDLSGLGPETPCPPPRDVAQKNLQEFCLQSKIGQKPSQGIASTPARSRRTKDNGNNHDEKTEPETTTPTTTPPAHLLLAARLREAGREASSDTENDEEPGPPLTSTPKNFAQFGSVTVESETESESERTPRCSTPVRVSCAPSPPQTPATPTSHHIPHGVQRNKEDAFPVRTNELPNPVTPATIHSPSFTPITPLWNANNHHIPVRSAFCNAPQQTQTHIPPTPSCAYQMGLPPPPPQYAPQFSAFALPQLQFSAYGSASLGAAVSTSTPVINDYPQDMDVDVDPNEPVPMDVDDPDIEMLDLTGQQPQPCLSAFNLIPERMGQYAPVFSSPAPPPPPSFRPASYSPFHLQQPVHGSQFGSHNPPIMATNTSGQVPGVEVFRNTNAPLYVPRSRENKRLNSASTDIGRPPPSVFSTSADFNQGLAWGHQNTAHRGLMSFGGMDNSRRGKQRRRRGEVKRHLREKLTQRQESGKLSRQIAAMTDPSKLTSRHMSTYAHGSIPKLLLKRQVQLKGQAAGLGTAGAVRREPRGIGIPTLQGAGAFMPWTRVVVAEPESEPSTPNLIPEGWGFPFRQASSSQALCAVPGFPELNWGQVAEMWLNAEFGHC